MIKRSGDVEHHDCCEQSGDSDMQHMDRMAVIVPRQMALSAENDVLDLYM